MNDPGVIRERLQSVRERIRDAAARAGRDPAGVHLVAVTKGHPRAAVEAALSLGLHDIGESRVQEAQAKQAGLAGGDARWHMLGHLQRNKARSAASLFDVIHSLDSAALASALERHRLERHRVGGAEPLPVLIEVELTGIASRSGVNAAAAADLLSGLRGLPHLSPVGLMTVAPPGPSAAVRACFARLRDLRDRLRQSHGLSLPELSMGMSGDFEIAVEEGATTIRLGTVLFGDLSAAGP